MVQNKWEFWIDRGGTFTDIVARKPNGTVITQKLLSENTAQYEDASIHGIKSILKKAGIELPRDGSLPMEHIATIKMGTTVATNALLEHKGEPTLLVITKGFGDALRIAYQTRPQLFALEVELPKMLYSAVLEVEERILADAKILIPLKEKKAEEEIKKFFEKGYKSIAIVLMHGYRYSQHEVKLGEIAHSIGFSQVSLSHKLSPLMKLVSRGDTTVVDAYLSPVLTNYVEKIASTMPELRNTRGRLMFMASSGGLKDAHFFKGKDAVLSGPAGGVIGMAKVSKEAGFPKVIGFDMGGTSTDVSHYGGELEKSFETEVAGVRLRTPMLSIHTVAAGGGSILRFDGARYLVGPNSSGSEPGPASYGKDGPLSITDCNVMLGKLQPEYFPKVFGKNSNSAIDTDIVLKKFSALSQEIKKATGKEQSPEAIAEGFLAVAVENMASAIKKISTQRGYDVSEYVLCCFGGAGGQHACLVAEALGMKRVFIHSHAGVLSAYGIGLADTVANKQKAVEKKLIPTLFEKLSSLVKELQEKGRKELELQGKEEIEFRNYLHLRCEGSDTALVVKYASMEEVVNEFHTLHKKHFGFISPEKELILESMEVEAIAPAMPLYTVKELNSREGNNSIATKKCYMGGEWIDCPFYERNKLKVDFLIKGPAIILDSTNTIVVEPGWQVKLTDKNNLVLERYSSKRIKKVGTEVDPVMLEIFNNLFMSIAEQMGAVLEKTASSVNIKERLDFSCAVFNSKGALVANAPHIPVHLGSMGESIKSLIREYKKEMKPGDAYVLNAPYNGGTHLPDLTVIKPVFNPKDPKEILFYVAARGHHTDIGGIAPGSCPADSKSIEEEGVVINNFKLVENGRFREEEIYKVLSEGPWPARNPKMNIADFKAQLGACEKGAYELLRLLEHYTIPTVYAYMQHIQDNAEEAVQKVLASLQDGEFTYPMDDGSRIAVKISVDQKNRKAIVDFTGTSKEHAGNFNAPPAVVRAAVLYVFRCLIKDTIPLNEGCLNPIEIIIPPGSMLRPQYPAAVIAGNVETSQCIVDTLFGALNTMAASQGTMNNFIWGNEHYQYYETICGGTGATPHRNGTDAVHSHMTNSRLTDPEVLEWRFPVILEAFAIRKDSGGKGRYQGGNGTIRRIRFLEKVTANILSGHRKVPPYGLNGGESGALGKNWVEHPDGTITKLSGVDKISLEEGDIFVMETPGGGGYGPKEST